MAMIANLLGGQHVLCCSSRVLKTFIMHAMLAATKQEGAKATKSHVGSHPAMPLRGIFQGKSYQDFKDPTLRVGAVRLHGE